MMAEVLSVRESKGTIVLIALFVGYLWWQVLTQLSTEWSINPQYSYGWLVPFLCLYLLWQAWEKRPAPRPPARILEPWMAVLGAGLLLLVLPTQMIQEANPDWRLVSWLWTLEAIGLTSLLIYSIGGGPWLRTFAFPVAFILVAVPWPTLIEEPLVQGLMRWVAAATVEIMVWLGTPAEARGNVIALPTSVVGIDEACSGVRSLQSVIMASLFIGELCALTAWRRVILLGVGVIGAVVGNLFRSVWLVGLAASEGASAIEDWHDTAGYSALAISLVLIGGLAWWWSRKDPGRSSKTRAAATAQPAGNGSLPPRWAMIVALAWLLTASLLTEAWFRWHEAGHETALSWHLRSPTHYQDFRRTELPQRTEILLRADVTDAMQWEDAAGRTWGAYFTRWDPGRNAAQLARLHRPEVCLPAAGAVIEASYPGQMMNAGELQLPFHHLVFIMAGHRLHVFHCLWEDRVASDSASQFSETWDASSRLEAAWRGRRHLGQQVLQIVLPGEYSVEEARRLLADHLPELIAEGPPK